MNGSIHNQFMCCAPLGKRGAFFVLGCLQARQSEQRAESQGEGEGEGGKREGEGERVRVRVRVRRLGGARVRVWFDWFWG